MPITVPTVQMGRTSRVGLVLLGIVAGQLILYGASFYGSKILLPLDILTVPGTYIPLQSRQEAQQPHNEYLSDPVFEDEPARLFRNTELRAGRLPLWNPYQYAGVPSMSFLSPFAIFGALIRSPRILPWLSLAVALVGGFGAYVFARGVLGVGVWPATIAAWCYPVTGFFVLWQSFSLAYPVVWLPWILYAIHCVLSGSNPWALPGLALATMLTLVSGHLDMAALVLVVGALFAIWDFFVLFHGHGYGPQAVRRLATVVVGWVLGFMLASPELLPAVEYAETGLRMSQRGAGHEDRPPMGPGSVAQLVVPHIYGAAERDSLAPFPKYKANLPETPAAGFTGLIASLVIAPLAWGSRRYRTVALFLAAIALLGMAWCLNIPGIIWLMRLPGLNMLSYNRFVFATSFAILFLATIGLELISKRELRWHPGYYVPIAILAGIATWCLFRSFVLPENIAVTLPRAVAEGHTMRWLDGMAGVHRIQEWFVRMYLSAAIVSTVAIAGWMYLALKQNLWRGAPLLFGLIVFGELLFFDYGRASQCDPKLYYPRYSVFDKIGHSWPGRVLGYKCLPASLLETQGFLDVRGYDGVDPARMVELLDLAREPGTPRLEYAAVQHFDPQTETIPFSGKVRLSPILDLLGVRYLVYPTPEGTGYFVLVNHSALPHVFVPLSVEVVPNEKRRLAKLASPHFDPRDIAYVEEQSDSVAAGRGDVKIVDATPQRIVMNAQMERGGLVVLADRWDCGWRAYIGDKRVPILHVNHALRGVIAPLGESTIIFCYQPTKFRLGLGAAAGAVLVLIANFAIQRRASAI